MGVLDGLDKILSGSVVTTGLLGINSTWSIFQGGTSFNPSTGKYDIKIVDSTDMVVVLPIEYNQSEIDGTRIKKGDYKLIVTGDKWDNLDSTIWGFSPSRKMRVQIYNNQFAFINSDSELEYKYFEVKDIKPNVTGDRVATWECQIRSA